MILYKLLQRVKRLEQLQPEPDRLYTITFANGETEQLTFAQTGELIGRELWHPAHERRVVRVDGEPSGAIAYFNSMIENLYE